MTITVAVSYTHLDVYKRQGRGGAGGGGGFGGRGGRGGPMVKPGTYTVTLGKLAAGILAPIGQPQKVEVVPLEASNR